MKVWLSAVLVLLFTACPELPPEAEPSGPLHPRRGLWILAEGTHRTLEDPAKVSRLLEDAEALGATDLFVQLYRGGRSWFPSQLADDTPYRRIVAEHGDPLPELIEAAHARGLRVHAWWNALSLARNRDAPLLRTVGRAAVLVDRQRRSLLDYPDLEVPLPDRAHSRIGTPGLWLDPATPGVIEHLEETLDELIAVAPGLDGLHLDFIRHPLSLPIVPGSRFEGLDFGYGQVSVERFENETGRKFRRGDDWDAFRRARVTEVVRRLGARLPPGWEHSAAVIAYADRAYLSAMQDWRGWLEDGLLDFAVAMAYTRDDRALHYLADGLRGGTGGDRVWLGLGTWLFGRDPARAQSQIEAALAVEPAGIALFSYDALAGRPELMTAVRPPAPDVAH